MIENLEKHKPSELTQAPGLLITKRQEADIYVRLE